MAINKYSVVETGNIGLGQAGSLFESGTVARTGSFVAITFLADTKFTLLTPTGSNYIGTAGGSGVAVPNTQVFPSGLTVFGRWDAFTLASGEVIAYTG